MRLTHSIPIAALSLTPFLVAGAAFADAPVRHVRGTLTKVTATALTVATPAGAVTVAIDAKTKVVGVVQGSAADITTGTYIGTANVPSAASGAARALEVVVFPKAMNGSGEGDYAWDLPANKARSMMTNGTVTPKSGSMMTNATVTGINGATAKTVNLVYKGGSKRVTIEAGTPVVRAEPGSTSLLVTGAHIVTLNVAAGTAAPFIVVGEHGVVPPM